MKLANINHTVKEAVFSPKIGTRRSFFLSINQTKAPTTQTQQTRSSSEYQQNLNVASSSASSAQLYPSK